MNTDDVSVNRKLIAAKRTKQILRNYNKKKDGINAIKKVIGTRKINKLKPELIEKIIDQYDGLTGYIINQRKKKPYLVLIYTYVDYQAQRTMNDKLESDTILVSEMMIFRDKKDRHPDKPDTQSVVYTYHAIKRMLERCDGFLQMNEDELLQEITDITFKVMEDFIQIDIKEMIAETERKMIHDEYFIIYKISQNRRNELVPLVATIYQK